MPLSCACPWKAGGVGAIGRAAWDEAYEVAAVWPRRRGVVATTAVLTQGQGGRGHRRGRAETVVVAAGKVAG